MTFCLKILMNTYRVENIIAGRTFVISTGYTLTEADQQLVSRAYVVGSENELFEKWKSENPDVELSEEEIMIKKRELFLVRNPADLPILVFLPIVDPGTISGDG